MIIIAVLATMALLVAAFIWQRKLKEKLEADYQKKKQLVERRSQKDEGILVGEEEQATVELPTHTTLDHPTSVIDWAATTSTLHQQISKLGVDYTLSRKLSNSCIAVDKELKQAVNELNYRPRLPAGTTDAEVKQSLSDVGNAYVVRQRAVLKLLDEVEPTQKACESSKTSWEALGTTIKQLKATLKESGEVPPFQAQVAIEAADSMLSEIEHVIVRDSKFAAARTAPNRPARAPSRKTLLPKLAKLLPALKDALEAYNVVWHTRQTTEELCVKADAYKAATFRQPEKPTTEEVERYLREIKQWATDRLTAHREASESITKYGDEKLKFYERVNDFRMQVNNFVSFLDAHLDEASLSEIGGAYRLYSVLNAEMDQLASLHSYSLKYKFTSNSPVTTLSTSEAAAIAQLQQLSRTVGFAAAQRTVAAVKYKTATHKCGPRFPSTPSMRPDFTLTGHLKDFEDYLKGTETANKELELLNAERALYASALNARRDKVSSSSEILAKLVSETASSLEDGSSDELRIAVNAAEQLCRDQEYTNNWERLTK